MRLLPALFALFHIGSSCLVAQQANPNTPASGKAAFKERAYFGAKFEPRSTVLHGAGQGESPELYGNYTGVLNADQKPAIFMYYVTVNPANTVEDRMEKIREHLASLNDPNIMLQIGVAMRGEKPDSKKPGPVDDLVAKGECDEAIEALCLALKQLGRPAFLRIGYEFEGKWNGYAPESYKQAFIRITKAMRRHEVNVATVWCSAGASAVLKLDRTLSFYPGDEWVDWWGIDLFDHTELVADSTRSFLAEAGKHRKPVMIGESTPRKVGVLKGRHCWDKWFEPYFRLIRETPEIKAFCYINWDWRNKRKDWRSWGDCRIEKNQFVCEKYREEMSLELYQHSPKGRH